MSKCNNCPIKGECWAQHNHKPFCKYIADRVPGRLEQLIALSGQNEPAELLRDTSKTGNSPDQSQDAVLFRLHNNTFTGYGQHSAAYAKQIDPHHPVRVVEIDRADSISPCDPWVDDRVIQPELSGEGGKVVFSIPQREIQPGDILATMWEADRLNPEQVANCNRAACVVVTCEAVAGWFRKSGVTVPIRVVPLGIAPDVFRYEGDEPEGGKFVVGAAGRLSHGGIRKGVPDIVRAFKLAFTGQDDVELRIKIWEDCELTPFDDPRIVVDRRPLPDEGVAQWLRECSVFATASRGEGWGFWAHQSLAVGRPIIAPLWGGTTAFADESCSYPVEFDVEPVPDGMPHYGGCSASWCVPRLDSLVAQMRAAYEDREERLRRGREGVVKALSLTWEHAGRELRAVLGEFGFIPPPPSPNFFQKAGNFVKATAIQIVAGNPISSPEVQAFRKATCEACPLYTISKSCLKCGCVAMDLKRSWQTSVCPDGRW